MAYEDIFDKQYVDTTRTGRADTASEIKKFLKEPLKGDAIKIYGNSKPQRVLIKGKISGR